MPRTSAHALRGLRACHPFGWRATQLLWFSDDDGVGSVGGGGDRELFEGHFGFDELAGDVDARGEEVGDDERDVVFAAACVGHVDQFVAGGFGAEVGVEDRLRARSSGTMS